MKKQDYIASFVVNKTAMEAFNTINNVTRWWTENLEGSSEKLDDEFSVRFGDVHYSKQKLTEVIPGKKIVWLVTDCRLNWIKDKKEWIGTTIVFDISEQGGSTAINFTHTGLVPGIECYNDCIKGWDHYFKNSLYKLLTEGTGLADKKAPV
jgi:hypothetical protein